MRNRNRHTIRQVVLHRTGLGGVADDSSRSGCSLAHLIGRQYDHLVRSVDRLTRDRQSARRRVDRPLLNVELSSADIRRQRRRILREAAPPDNVVEPRRVLFRCRNRLRDNNSPSLRLFYIVFTLSFSESDGGTDRIADAFSGHPRTPAKNFLRVGAKLTFSNSIKYELVCLPF